LKIGYKAEITSGVNSGIFSYLDGFEVSGADKLGNCYDYNAVKASSSISDY
jgi:hypothetical protein